MDGFDKWKDEHLESFREIAELNRQIQEGRERSKILKDTILNDDTFDSKINPYLILIVVPIAFIIFFLWCCITNNDPQEFG